MNQCPHNHINWKQNPKPSLLLLLVLNFLLSNILNQQCISKQLILSLSAYTACNAFTTPYAGQTTIMEGIKQVDCGDCEAQFLS